MSQSIVIRPGRTPLAFWRAIHDGEVAALDPSARIDVEAGRAALDAIVTQDDPTLDPQDNAPSVAQLVEARGAILPDGELRLFTALKLASLAQGVSGVRWELIETLNALLANDLLPAVPDSANNRLALAHLFAAVTGTGEVLHGGRIRGAGDMLRAADLRPFSLGPRERSALLSGTALSIASTLAALFAADRVFQSALVAAAVFAPDAAFHPSVHRLNRQRGQSEIAVALRSLSPRDATETPIREGANADRSVIFRAGAVLDLLRQAAALLERAANGVTEDRLILWQSEEAVAGAEDTTSVALAADLIAIALAALGELVAGLIAAGARDDGPKGPAGKAASLAAKNRKRAGVPALDPAGIVRLGAILETASTIVAIALIEAARCKDAAQGGPAKSLALVREAAPRRDDATALTGDLRAVAELVRSDALATASGTPLPSAVPIPSNPPPLQPQT